MTTAKLQVVAVSPMALTLYHESHVHRFSSLPQYHRTNISNTDTRIQLNAFQQKTLRILSVKFPGSEVCSAKCGGLSP